MQLPNKMGLPKGYKIMGKILNRNIDYEAPLKKMPSNSGRVGEDAENLPKKEGIAHAGSWRYKRGFIYQKVIDRMMKKHLGENYNVLYAEIAKKYKTGSLERLHVERELVTMATNGIKYATLWSGYFIDEDEIIRYAQVVNGKITVLA